MNPVPCRRSAHPPAPELRGGYTLIEVIVVLVLIGLAASLVAPALIFRSDGTVDASLASVVTGARKLALRRAEELQLRVRPDGTWSVEGTVSALDVPPPLLAEGRLQPAYHGPQFRLLFSPLGTCGFDLESVRAAGLPRIDPLICRVDE